LVKGIIPREGLIVAWGPPKCGKSFWIFDLAMHVALGWQYRDRRVQQGAVVYCAFEGQTGIQARVEAFRQTFPIEMDGPVPFYLQPVTLDLVAAHAGLITAIKGKLTTAPALVVLDTLNRSLRGSENDSKDMAAYIAAADAIREAMFVVACAWAATDDDMRTKTTTISLCIAIPPVENGHLGTD
jgi:RecA-family ATPase